MVVFSYDMDNKSYIYFTPSHDYSGSIFQRCVLSVSSNELLIVSFLNLLTCNIGAQYKSFEF